MDISTTDHLAKRFGHRLNLALDGMGYSPLPLTRAKTLARELNHDVSKISTLLNGMLMPEWGVLLKLCAVLDREPGYFLDDAPEKVPSDTRSVKPLGPGENIVVRIPPKSNAPWGAAQDDWTWIEARHKMGFGVLPGDYVINFSPQEEPAELKPSLLYLLGIENHLELRRCQGIVDGSVCMTGINPITQDNSPRFFPVTSSDTISTEVMDQYGAHHLGYVAMTMRSSNTMLQLF